VAIGRVTVLRQRYRSTPRLETITHAQAFLSPERSGNGVMSHYLWTKLLWHIVSLGDVGVALPIATILFVWLCAHRRWQTGIWCVVAVLGCSAAIFFLKLAFFAGELRLPGLENPSGHSAVGAVVYGSLAWILSREMPGWRSRVVLLLGCTSIAAIGASLYVVRAHTLAEVLVGLTLGGACAMAFARLGCRDDVRIGRTPARLMLVIAIAALSLQGLHLATRLSPTNLLLFMPSLTTPA
jgi:membrane-associated phospholipid phosphatase